MFSSFSTYFWALCALLFLFFHICFIILYQRMGTQSSMLNWKFLFLYAVPNCLNWKGSSICKTDSRGEWNWCTVCNASLIWFPNALAEFSRCEQLTIYMYLLGRIQFPLFNYYPLHLTHRTFFVCNWLAIKCDQEWACFLLYCLCPAKL